MGRRRRNQDTTQIANADHSAVAADNQLQVTSSEDAARTVSTDNLDEAKNTKTVEEIPYEDRPIPEAYFPPEEASIPEFMPEPHIQTTPTPIKPVKSKSVTAEMLDALKFDVKPVETKTVKTTSVTTEMLDALKFDVKPVETKSVETKEFETKPVETASVEAKTEVKESPVAAPKIDFTALQFDTKQYLPKSDSVKHQAPLTANTKVVAVDSLVAQTDSLASDSLANDSVVFIQEPIPEPKREIIAIDGKEMPETITNTWWYHPLLLVLFVAYAIIIRDRKKAIMSEMLSFIKPNTDESIFGFQWLQNSKYKFFLSTLGVISASLYLFLANNMPVSSCWIFLLAVTLFVVGKKIMLALLEYIYFEGADIASMSGAFMVMVRQTGLMLIPSVLGLSFAPEEYRSIFAYLGIFIVGIAILAFILKIILNFLRGITSIFYLILYLCTLEVIPVAIFFVLGLLPRL